MNRARSVVAATLAGASLLGVCLLAQTQSQTQTPKPPEMKSVLAGKKFTTPIKGPAEIDYFKAQTRREGTTLVTKITVKNTSNAPIPRLKVAETWYDKDGNMIPGADAVINGLLQPGEVGTLELRTPVNPKMASSMLQFSHANGTVPKPHPVKTLEALSGAAKEPATKTASATKTAKKK
jgi:hypothetical protein